MGLRVFLEKDVDAAGRMACDVWEDELSGASMELNRFIHAYLVRYYDVNRRFSFSATGNRLDAFLLAGFKRDGNNSDEWFEHGLSAFSAPEKKVALEYRHYLVRNGEAVQQFMGESDVQMGLFISRANGKGRLLLDTLEKHCRKNGVENLFLWADATCNVSYYEKNGFESVACFESTAPIDNGRLETTVFRKRLDKRKQSVR